MNRIGGLRPSFNHANQIFKDNEGNYYGYDGNGLRVREQNGNLIDYYFYDAAGVLRYRYGRNLQIQSEYHTVAEQVFARRDLQNGTIGTTDGGGGDGGTTGGDGNDPACVDDNGDGYGWNGTETCIPDGGGSDGGGSTDGGDSGAACVDDDGDGWGWDGTASCRVDDSGGGTTGGGGSEPPCIDDDGDGWGWNGTESCRP